MPREVIPQGKPCAVVLTDTLFRIEMALARIEGMLKRIERMLAERGA